MKKGIIKNIKKWSDKHNVLTALFFIGIGLLFIILLLNENSRLGFFLVIYFLPFVVAIVNKKKNTSAIFVLNLFLGWTGIGWVIALIWAVMND